MSIFSEILIIIKFGEKLQNIYNMQPLDCPNPRLASWTDFNARRLRKYSHTSANVSDVGLCVGSIAARPAQPCFAYKHVL